MIGPGNIFRASSSAIDVKENAGAIARLQRDLPGVETNLRTSRDNWQSVGTIADEAKRARQRGDNMRANELEKQAHETRERAEAFWVASFEQSNFLNARFYFILIG